MNNGEGLADVLERMRRDWDERALTRAERYVYTRDSTGDEADFEESGRVNYNQLVRPFLPILLDGRSAQSCRVVEIGCGVGRMTRWFAEEFLEVHGIDISQEMLERARHNLRNYPNALLHLGSGMDLAGLPGSHFELAFSYITFQHIPSRAVIENYLRETARVLKAAGGFKFQLNGDQSPAYRRREKDTWLGEAFSFTEAEEMLTRAGFHLLAAEGQATQYFVLTAQKGGGTKETALRPYVLPGEPWAASQLLEGWRQPGASGRPFGPRCRTRLAVPPREHRRVFLAAYFLPVEPFLPRRLAVMLGSTLIGETIIRSKGDYYYEWPVPRAAISAPDAELTLELDPPYGPPMFPSVRCLGIYTPRE